MAILHGIGRFSIVAVAQRMPDEGVKTFVKSVKFRLKITLSGTGQDGLWRSLQSCRKNDIHGLCRLCGLPAAA